MSDCDAWAMAGYSFVGEVSGFDLSAFTAFAPQRLPIHGTMTAWDRLSIWNWYGST